MGHLLMKNPLPHTFYQERFDTFHFDTFHFETFRFDVFRFDVFLFEVFRCDAVRFATAGFLAHLHRTFRCDSIDTMGLFDPLLQVFYRERFGAFRCAPTRTPCTVKPVNLCVFNSQAPVPHSSSTHSRRLEASASCHRRRDSMLSRSGLPTFRVTIIAKSRTPSALAPRSSLAQVHRDRSSGRTL
jgi:hypothetical protein